MRLPERAVQIIHTLHSLHLDLARGDDPQRRALTRMMAEQIAFELGPRWGCKARSEALAAEYQSKDAIAYLNDDGSMDIWDWQNGSSREPQVHPNMEPMYANERQWFIRVNPVNHLKVPAVAPDPPPHVDPPAPQQPIVNGVSAEEVRAIIGEFMSEQGALLHPRLTMIEASVMRLEDRLSEKAPVVAQAKPPEYEGQIVINLGILGTRSAHIKLLPQTTKS